MLKAGVGWSVLADPAEAGKQSAEQAMRQLDGQAGLAIVFCTVGYDAAEFVGGARAALGGTSVEQGPGPRSAGPTHLNARQCLKAVRMPQTAWISPIFAVIGLRGWRRTDVQGEMPRHISALGGTRRSD